MRSASPSSETGRPCGRSRDHHLPPPHKKAPAEVQLDEGHVATKGKQLMITLSPTSHTSEDGVETYAYPSTLHPTQHHHVASVDGGPWRIAPVDIARDSDLTVDQAKRLFDEIRFLIQTAEKLERSRVKAAKDVSPLDQAVTDEVLAIMGDRDWTIDDLASAAGTTRAKLLHRINGHSRWTLGDLWEIAEAVEDDDDERVRLVTRLFECGRSAAAAVSL